MTQELNEGVDEPQPIASRRHLIVFLLVQLAIAINGGLRYLAHEAATGPGQLRFSLTFYYVVAMIFAWAQLAYVWYGIRKSQISIRKLIGGRWASLGDVLKDVLIGFLFWVLWIIALIVISNAFGPRHGPSKVVQLLTPRTTTEFVLWIALSASAGFCEEVVYRGYLQQQFFALQKDLPIAILSQTLVFGLAHSYQGIVPVIGICAMGMLFGMLAARRKSLRPGILAHIWHDELAGALMYLFARYR